MEDTALCIRLFVNMLMLLAAEVRPHSCAEAADAAFLQIVPNRLQFFEYESISCDCEGFDDSTVWRVKRSIEGGEMISGPETPAGTYVIKHAFESDSGEYWCEAAGAKRGSSVTISVTGGSVILEIPAVPVTEGDDVTLNCRNKTTSSVPVADFYEDGKPIGTGFKGNLTIRNVSKSGLYRCDMVGVGESAQSWLSVRAKPSMPVRHPSFSRSILWVTVAACSSALLLLVAGLSFHGKRELTTYSLARTPAGAPPADADQPSSDIYNFYCTID